MFPRFVVVCFLPKGSRLGHYNQFTALWRRNVFFKCRGFRQVHTWEISFKFRLLFVCEVKVDVIAAYYLQSFDQVSFLL